MTFSMVIHGREPIVHGAISFSTMHLERAQRIAMFKVAMAERRGEPYTVIRAVTANALIERNLCKRVVITPTPPAGKALVLTDAGQEWISGYELG